MRLSSCCSISFGNPPCLPAGKSQDCSVPDGLRVYSPRSRCQERALIGNVQPTNHPALFKRALRALGDG